MSDDIATLRHKLVAKIKAFEDAHKERISALTEADEENRAIILPCRPGEAVYTILLDKVIEKRVGKFIVNSYTRPMIWAELDCGWCSSETVRWDLAIGKTVFLTRKEAEKALEAMKNAD